MIEATVVTLNGGYQGNKDHCAKHNLQVGNKYIVKDIDIGQSSSSVFLQGLSWFNTIYFTFEEDGEELDIYSDTRFNNYI